MFLTILAVLSLVALSILSSPSLQSSAASAWPMFHGNAQHTGLSPFPGPTVPFLRWTFQTRGPVDASPTVGHGRIYVTSEDGNLYALNMQGQLLWKFQTNSTLISSPAIGSDGTIYLGSSIPCLTCRYSQSEGIVYAINPAGKLKWNLTIEAPEGGSLSSPTIGRDGTIYMSQVGFSIAAVNSNGTLKWQLTTGGEVFDPPALAPDGTLYAGIDDPDPSGACGECFVALNPDGTVKWSLGQFEIGGFTSGFSSPAVGSDGTIYVDGTALNPDGTVKWRNPGTFLSPSIGSDGTVYGSGEGGLFALNSAGSLKWEFPVGKSGGTCSPSGCSYVFVQQSSAALASNGLAYFGSGVTYLPSGSFPYGTSTLYAVTQSGTLAWRFVIASSAGSNFSVSDPAVGSDGTIYVGSADGNVYAFGQA